MTKEIMIRQYSYCTKCKGRAVGCDECSECGVICTLIPLSSLLPHERYEYTKAQADFIREQKKEGADG